MSSINTFVPFQPPSAAAPIQPMTFSPDKEIDWELEIKKKLEEFKRTPSNPEIYFPSMPRDVRKICHTLARKMGLNSRSLGQEPERICIVSRRRVNRNIMSQVAANDLSPVETTKEMKSYIVQLVSKHPITSTCVNQHLSTKSNSEAQRRKHLGNSARGGKMIIPPRIESPFMSFRRQLPAYNQRCEILEAISSNQVVLITGGTGCGKTTQVPQFILEEAFEKSSHIRIICTQPRRLPAIAVAERVAKERKEHLGHTVGYHIRLEQKTTASTVLTYCTSGVLLRMLSQDDTAQDISHIILDEIHEREQNTDYLLIALKQALRKRPSLKIILMSATMEGNLKLFMEYFGQNVQVKHIDIPSRLFPVDKFFLGDVLALTGYTPAESVFGGHFPPVSSFPTVSCWDGITGNSGLSQMTEANQPPNQLDCGIAQNQSQPVPDNMLYPLAKQLASVSQMEMDGTSMQYAPAMYHPGTSMVPETQFNDQSVDVYDMQCDGVAPEVMEQFRQMGMQGYVQDTNFTTNNPHEANLTTWQHTQSFVTFPETHNELHRWEPQPLQTPRAQPSFYVAPDEEQVNRHSTMACDNAGFIAQPRGGMHHSISLGGQMSHYSGGTDHVTTMLNREKQATVMMKQQLKMALQNKPHHFAPNSKQILEGVEFDRAKLVEIYRHLGGMQYSESLDLDLILATIKYCVDSPVRGAILVFLPGYDDITHLRDRINNETWTGMAPEIYMLHSQMNSSDQQRVFEKCQPNVRKVILSTNIAEASVTIDDVVFVIDTGKVKQKTYDHESRISQLQLSSIAKSNAEQRSGRAGRCQKGYCLRLYSEQDFEKMLVTQTAEMQRAAIHDVCLHAKMFAPPDMTVKQFLKLAPEPPLPSAIDTSMRFLEQLGALYSESSTKDVNKFDGPFMNLREAELTTLGKLIAQLPLDPQLARLLLFGLALKCLSSAVTLVAALSHRDPFILPNLDDRDKANSARDQFGLYDFSDHIALLRVFREFDSKGNKEASFWCRQNFIAYHSLRMIQGIRRQLVIELRRAGLITFDGDYQKALCDPNYNRYSDCWPMVQAAIVAGCYPGIGFVRKGNKLKKIRTSSQENAVLHPSSIIKRQLLSSSKRSDVVKKASERCSDLDVEYLAFQEFAKISEGLTIRTVTAVPPSPVILFAGAIRLKQSIIEDYQLVDDCQDVIDDSEVAVEGFPELSVLELDEDISVRGEHTNLQRMLQLRFKFMSYFIEVMSCPKLLSEPVEEHSSILYTLANVLMSDHRQMGFNPVSKIAEISRIPLAWLTAQQSMENAQKKQMLTPNSIRQNDAPQKPRTQPFCGVSDVRLEKGNGSVSHPHAGTPNVASTSSFDQDSHSENVNKQQGKAKSFEKGNKVAGEQSCAGPPNSGRANGKGGSMYSDNVEKPQRQPERSNNNNSRTPQPSHENRLMRSDSGRGMKNGSAQRNENLSGSFRENSKEDWGRNEESWNPRSRHNVNYAKSQNFRENRQSEKRAAHSIKRDDEDWGSGDDDGWDESGGGCGPVDDGRGQTSRQHDQFNRPPNSRGNRQWNKGYDTRGDNRYRPMRGGSNKYQDERSRFPDDNVDSSPRYGRDYVGPVQSEQDEGTRARFDGNGSGSMRENRKFKSRNNGENRGQDRNRRGGYQFGPYQDSRQQGQSGRSSDVRRDDNRDNRYTNKQPSKRYNQDSRVNDSHNESDRFRNKDELTWQQRDEFQSQNAGHRGQFDNRYDNRQQYNSGRSGNYHSRNGQDYSEGASYDEMDHSRHYESQDGGWSRNKSRSGRFNNGRENRRYPRNYETNDDQDPNERGGSPRDMRQQGRCGDSGGRYGYGRMDKEDGGRGSDNNRQNGPRNKSRTFYNSAGRK